MELGQAQIILNPSSLIFRNMLWLEDMSGSEVRLLQKSSPHLLLMSWHLEAVENLQGFQLHPDQIRTLCCKATPQYLCTHSKQMCEVLAVSRISPRTSYASCCLLDDTNLASDGQKQELVPGVGCLSRSQVASLYKGHKKLEKPTVAECPETIEKSVGGARTVASASSPRQRPCGSTPQRMCTCPRRAVNPQSRPPPLFHHPQHCPHSPCWPFRGTCVVFLKQLESGLLLVTGLFKVNSVPLRQVNQAYDIATSTKLELDGFKVRFCPISSLIMVFISSCV